MVKKLLIAFLAITATLLSALGLAACGGGRNVSQDDMEFTLISEGMYDYMHEYYDYEVEIIYDTYNLSFIYSDKLDGADVVIPAEVNGKPVTMVTAFFANSGIKSIVFPDSVKNIISDFSNCKKLESVTLPSGLKNLCDFSGCTSLEEINIPDGVKEIGYSAFSDCTSLKSIVIPDSVTKIGGYAFSGCTSLETAVVPDAELGDRIFMNCTLKNITAPADVINDYFFDCTLLENVDIISGEVISGSVFALPESDRYGSEYIDLPLNVTLPSTINQIDSKAFADRKNITINIPDTDTLFNINFAKNWNGSYYGESYIDSLGNEMRRYEKCNIQLKINGNIVTNLEIPSNVEELSYYMLDGFTKIQSFTVDENNANYFAQDNILYNKEKTEFLVVPDWISGSVTIPYGITAIENEFRISDNKITELHFPDSVTSFRQGALGDCLNLESLTIPFAGLTKNDGNLSALFSSSQVPVIKKLTVNGGTLNFNSFDGRELVKGIENLVLGDGVTTVSYGYFTNLKTITIGKNVTSISLSAAHLVEIYNYSKIVIEKGSSENGGIGLNALGVYTSPDVQSKVKTIDGGYTIFEDGNDVYLLGYDGNEENLVLPEKLNGKNYNIHNYAFLPDLSGTTVDDIIFNSVCLKSIVIPDGVTSIGSYVFFYQIFLTSVDLGAGVKVIGEYAFTGCEKLSTIDLSNIQTIGEQAFSNCYGLSSIDLSNIKTIGESAFYNCTDIQSIVLGNSLEEVGNNAFYAYYELGNLKITSLTAPANALAYIPSNYLKTVNITGGTEIPDYAFQNNTVIEKIEIADTVTKIGNYAFNGCTALSSLKIPSSVVEIGVYVFTGCTGLTSDSVNGINYINNFVISCDSDVTVVSLKEGTTHILENAFKDCNNIESIDIPDSVIFIGSGAFKNCTNLVSVKISKNISMLSSEIFYGCKKLQSLTTEGNDGTDHSIVITDNIKSIGSEAFYNCTEIQSIVIPDGVQVGYNVFYNCFNIENAVIPAKLVSEIYKYNLKTLVINGSDSFAQGVLYGAGKLESLTIPFVGGSSSPSNNLSKMFGYIFGTQSYSNSVEAIQQHTFISNYAYSEIFYLPANLTDVTVTGGYLYQGCFSGCTNIKNITLGEGCTFSQLEMRTFYGCTSLESFTVPESVEVIEQEAFSGCESLKELDLSNTCFIRGLAFENCVSLEELVIPRAVVTINEQAFKGCSGLESVEFVLSDWVRTSASTMGSTSIDVSDSAQNAVNIRGSWMSYMISNMTRMKEYYGY